jgi:cobalamin biosynthesis protein CobT
MSNYSLTNHAMSTEEFTIEASGTGRTFGRKFDINVVFSGDNAATNGGTIVLPSLPHDTQLTSDQVLVARGYIDHEAAHVRHSEMDVMAKCIKECAESGNKILPRVLNGIEDVRIERKTIDEYPGSLRNLTATTHAVNSEFLERHGDTDAASDRQRIMSIALTWAGRRDMGYDTDTCQKCLDLMPEGLRKETEAWAKAIKGCRSTEEALGLARRIDADIREKTEEDGDEPIDGEPYDVGNDGRPVKRSGEGEGEGNVSNYGQAQEGGGIKEEQDYDVQPNEALESTWREAIQEGNRAEKYRPMSTFSDKLHTRHDKHNKYSGGGTNNRGHRHLAHGSHSEYEEIKSGMVGKLNTMRRKLERAITAKMERNWAYGLNDGNLDSRRLTAAYNGSPNVYKAREQSDDFDTSVTILIDLSGSMLGNPALLAQNVAIALGECLERTPVEYEILGFNNTSGHLQNDPVRFDPPEGDWSRWEPLDMYVFKDFDERLYDARGAMSSIAECAGGNNSDGDALIQAWGRLKKRASKRKIFVTLSDGYPACHCDHGYTHLNGHLRDVVSMIEGGGADVVGIGIMSDAVQQFYPRWQVINELEDLPKATMDELGKLLINERYMPDNSDLMKVFDRRVSVAA